MNDANKAALAALFGSIEDVWACFERQGYRCEKREIREVSHA